MFNAIKIDLQLQINRLTKLKTALSNSPNVIDSKMKSKLRIQIESYLIDINEEMFSISDELARAFLNPNVAD